MTLTTNQDEINAIIWKACDTFRGTIDPSEYKNYILVMLFLKYVSDVWFDHREQYEREFGGDPSRVERHMHSGGPKTPTSTACTSRATRPT
ncbi:MAG: type I restriction-modification system subunit M N-terminal domain-containing protein [Chloroflexi bacterium]|nr:type I restriction-modification system subunit M N-terminal domain-containing protein [Chloroflexota bacterium]